MVSHALQTSLAQLLDASRARRSPAGGPPHESGCWSGRPVTGLGAAEHHSVGRSVIPGPRPCGRRRVKPPPEGSSATPSLASRITASGREYQFAVGDSGRSGDVSAARRARRLLHIHQRSLSMRDQRQADDCCVGVTVHRGRTDHRPQPLLNCRSPSACPASKPLSLSRRFPETPHEPPLTMGRASPHPARPR